MRDKGPRLFFLDTNIFAYSFDLTAPAKRNRALNLVREAVTQGRGVVSFQVVQEFFRVALHRFPQPMSHAEAERYLAMTFRPILSVHSSVELYQEGLLTSQRYRLSWFDALIVAAAQTANCDVLYTEDLQDGQRFGALKVENPFTDESGRRL